MNRIFVGVDGGGTRTRCVVVDEQLAELARGESDAGLVDAAAPTAGVPALVTLVRATLQQAGLTPPVHGICCALAGVGRAEQRDGVRRALAAHALAAMLTVVTDAEAAMQASFGSTPGILLICGTGSIAWARDEASQLHRAGGWGAILGDEGSAYAVGIAALRAVARAHDGRGPATALTARVLEATGVATPELLIPWAARAAKGYIAALAPHVTGLATTDAAAERIVDDAVVALAEHVRAVRARLGPADRTYDVALSGGLLAPGSVLRERIDAVLGAMPGVRVRGGSAADAALGAAAIAIASAH